MFEIHHTVDILTGEGVTDPLGILPSGVCEPVRFISNGDPPRLSFTMKLSSCGHDDSTAASAVVNIVGTDHGCTP